MKMNGIEYEVCYDNQKDEYFAVPAQAIKAAKQIESRRFVLHVVEDLSAPVEDEVLYIDQAIKDDGSVNEWPVTRTIRSYPLMPGIQLVCDYTSYGAPHVEGRVYFEALASKVVRI